MSPLLIKVLAGLALLAAVMVGLHLYDVHQQELGAAQFKADAAAQALAAEQEAHRESDRRAVAIQGIAHDADQAASAARADADAAHSAGDRLQQRFAALRRSAALNSAASASGTAGSDTGDLSAYVFRSVREMAGRYAAIADQARISGSGCEQSYDALTVPAH